MKIKCPDCNCTAHSLDGHYMAKLKGQVEKVKRTGVKCKRCGRRYTAEDTSKGKLNEKQWRVCITDCYYLKLKEFNRPYKGELDGQLLEIPWKQFRKEHN